MSISGQQYPTKSDVKHYLHMTIYPEYYTTISSQYTLDDFKYLFKLYTKDGLISQTKNPPYIIDGVGVYNPNIYLKNMFGNDFQLGTNLYYKCSNSIIEYRVAVDEWSKSISSPLTHSYTKVFAVNGNKEDFVLDDYILTDSTSNFLTDWSSRRRVDLTTDEGNIRWLNGELRGTFSTPKSMLYQVRIIVRPGDGYQYYYYSEQSNPYWGAKPSNNNVELEDAGEFLLETPATPKNLMKNKWHLKTKLELSTGLFTPMNMDYSNNMVQQYAGSGAPYAGSGAPQYMFTDGCEYDIMAYTWPYGDDYMTSKTMKFIVDNYCDNRTPIQLLWQNDYGAYDFYTFTHLNTLKEGTNRSSYTKNRDSIGGSGTQYYMGHDDLDRGETTMHVDIKTEYTMTTDWVSDEEMLELRQLWYSKSIYMNYEGSIYPVVGLSNSQLIKTNKKGLRKYSFNVRLSNKRYN